MPRIRAVLAPVLLLTATAIGCASGGSAELPEADGALAERGRTLVQVSGCTNCHSADGSRGVGPTWEGLAGSTVELDGGGTVVADAAYLRESITDPDARIVAGYAPVMPSSDLPDDELDAIVAYLEQLGDR